MIAQRGGADKYTVWNLGGWPVVSSAEKHYTGSAGQVLRKAMACIASKAR